MNNYLTKKENENNNDIKEYGSDNACTKGINISNGI